MKANLAEDYTAIKEPPPIGGVTGPDFQERLLVCIAGSTSFLKQCRAAHALSVDDFDDPLDKQLAHVSLGHYDRYGDAVGSALWEEFKKHALSIRMSRQKKQDHKKVADKVLSEIARLRGKPKLSRPYVKRVKANLADFKRKRAADFLSYEIAKLNAEALDPQSFNEELRRLVRWYESVSPSERDEFDRVIDEWSPRPMGKAAFHGALGRIVKVHEPYTAVSREMILTQALVALGSMIAGPAHDPDDPDAARAVSKHDRPHYKVAGTHATNLYMLFVGGSSEGKGTTVNLVNDLIEVVEPSFAERQVFTHIGSGQRLVELVADEGSYRKEKKGELVEVPIPGADHKNVLIIEEEFARVMRIDASKESVLTHYLRSFWDGHKVSNQINKKPQVAANAAVSLVGQITPAELRKIVRDVDLLNGFYNRFIFCHAAYVKEEDCPEKVPRAKLLKLRDELKRRIARARQIREMQMSAEVDWHAQAKRLMYKGDDEFPTLMKRARPIVIRIAMIYAALDGEPEIGPAHVKAARAVWDYSAQVCWKSLLGHRDLTASPRAGGKPLTPYEATRQWIVAQLRTGPKPLSFFTKGKKAAVSKMRQSAIKELLAAGAIRRERGEAGSRGGPRPVLLILKDAS